MATPASVNGELAKRAIKTLQLIQSQDTGVDRHRYDASIHHLLRLSDDCYAPMFWELKAMQEMSHLACTLSEDGLDSSSGTILVMVQQMFFPEAVWEK